MCTGGSATARSSKAGGRSPRKTLPVADRASEKPRGRTGIGDIFRAGPADSRGARDGNIATGRSSGVGRF